MAENIIYTKHIDSPLGTLIMGATVDGICLLEFTDRDILKNEFNHLCRLLDAETKEADSPYFKLLELELAEYFTGKRKAFEVPLVLTGTEFQKKVWTELLNIPYGTTRSYKQQSKALKQPEAIRAVAHANGTNRIAILIPCHRVIGENGSLTGYGGGLWRKKWLLDLESGSGKLF
ncbi:MAG TPA: methylated-DNA--[protein]-cysteine S-methyltransferase [Chitinophagales bacterium]|nr:methylated-DNA--[protein]-cysteine S-methyltransferase [Chitinophagales bacterium]